MGVKNAVYLCIEQQNQNRNISIETDSITVPYILRNFNFDSIQCDCQTSMFHTMLFGDGIEPTKSSNEHKS